MKKSLISIILALVMASSLLASCGSGSSKKTETTSSTKSTATSTETTDPDTAEVDSYVSDLASGKNYDGKTFTYIGRNGDNNFPEKEEITGSLTSDALYNRQREIEEKFSVKWVNNTDSQDGPAVADKVTQEVMAGGTSYDLVFGNLQTCGQTLFTGGVLMNINDTSIDLSKKWWVSGLNDMFAIDGKMYFLIGSIVTNNFTNSSCVLYNKQVASDYSISGLYDLVNSGEWTIDKMLEVASAVPAVTSTSTGTFRFTGLDGVNMLFAAGYRITNFDADGTPTVEKTLPSGWSDLADKVSAAMGDKTQAMYWESSDTFETTYGTKNIGSGFVDGRALFYFDNTGEVSALREEDVEFGVLPMPKKDTSQTNYYSFCSPWNSGGVYIPKVVQDTDMSSVIADAMGALSQKYVKTAFYDKLLKGRSVSDGESRDMLDIIFAGNTYDLCTFYAGGNMNTAGEYLETINKAISKDSSSFASSYAGQAKVISNTLKQLVQKITKNS